MQKAVSDARNGLARPNYQRSNILRTLMNGAALAGGHACGDSAHHGRRGRPATHSVCGAGPAARHQDRGGQRVVHHRGHRPHDAGRDPPEQGGTPRGGVRGPEVQRFDALRVGDVVTFRYFETVVTALSRPGAAAPAASTSVTRTPGGAGSHHRSPDHRHRYARGDQSEPTPSVTVRTASGAARPSGCRTPRTSRATRWATR